MGANRIGTTGRLPPDDVDHKDVDGLNNKWCNLRAATRAQNLGNMRRPVTNKSGFKGVCATRGRWRAQIRLAGRSHYLGEFDTPEEAHAVYLAALRAKCGEFARAA